MRAPIRLFACAAVLFLAACGGRPTQTLNEAEAALADARLAEKCAPEEYAAAKRMLDKANALAEKGEHDEAKSAAVAAKKLALKARNKALLNKDECEKRDQPATQGIDPNAFVDQTGGTAVEADSGGLKTIFFDYNAFELTPEGRKTLGDNGQWLNRHSNTKITIEGHCDKRGSTEYNLALGEKRAQGVRQYLKSLGVALERMAIISYGEEKPLDMGESESAHAKNRRAEFVVRSGQ